MKRILIAVISLSLLGGWCASAATSYYVQIGKADASADQSLQTNDAESALLWAALTAVQGDTVWGIKYNRGNGLWAYRKGDKILIRTYRADPSLNTNVVVNSIDVATNALASALSPEDGYDIISLEQPVGSRNSILLEHRPPLVPSYYRGTEPLHSLFVLKGGSHGRGAEFPVADETPMFYKEIRDINPDTVDLFKAWLEVYNAKVPAGVQVTPEELGDAFMGLRTNATIRAVTPIR